jgi:hypothetical protein
MVFIRTEIALGDRHIFFVEIGHYAKGTAGSPLAKRTMANASQILIPDNAIPHGSTETPAFVYFSHLVPLVEC